MTHGYRYDERAVGTQLKGTNGTHRYRYGEREIGTQFKGTNGTHRHSPDERENGAQKKNQMKSKERVNTIGVPTRTGR